jgi:hypothetical protein
MYNFVRGDTDSALRVTCLDNVTSNPINLKNNTVNINWRTNKDVLVSRSMDIIDEAKGIVQYQFKDKELESPEMTFEIVINYSSGKIISCKQLIVVIVRERV